MASFNQLLKKKNEEESLLSRNRKSVGVASIAKEIDKVMLVNLSDILPNMNQPRKNFEKDESIRSLADSIKEVGLQSPIVVNRTGSRYQILIGHRRYYAYTNYIPEQKQIKCIVWNREKMTDQERDRIALVENLQRESLKPSEIAETIYKLKQTEKNIDDLIKITGYKRASIFSYQKAYQNILEGKLTPEVLNKWGIRNINLKSKSPTVGLEENIDSPKLKIAKKNSKSFKKIMITDTEKLEELEQAQKALENQLTIVKRLIKKLANNGG